MTASMLEVIKRIAEIESRKIHVAELAIVTAVFPHSGAADNDNYECDIRLKDKDVELKKVPIATQHIGLANAPHVGDLVVIMFINGDINSPIVMGRLYNDDDRPPLNDQEEIIYQPPYNQNTGLRRLYIELPGEAVKITLSDKGIDIDTDFDIHIHSKGKTTIECDSDLSFKATTINLESQAAMNIKCASGIVTIEGKVVKIN